MLLRILAPLGRGVVNAGTPQYTDVRAIAVAQQLTETLDIRFTAKPIATVIAEIEEEEEKISLLLQTLGVQL